MSFDCFFSLVSTGEGVNLDDLGNRRKSVLYTTLVISEKFGEIWIKRKIQAKKSLENQIQTEEPSSDVKKVPGPKKRWWKKNQTWIDQTILVCFFILLFAALFTGS